MIEALVLDKFWQVNPLEACTATKKTGTSKRKHSTLGRLFDREEAVMIVRMISGGWERVRGNECVVSIGMETAALQQYEEVVSSMKGMKR
jgi:hypothetical protein